MGKITEALKKVTDERIKRVQKRPEFRYVVKKVKNATIDQHVVAFHDPSSPIGEAFNILRTNIQSLHFTNNFKSFLITSSIDGEGKTITALNTAITLAHDLNGKSVLLIDADMRKGRIAKYLGIKSHKGLSEVLQEDGLEFENVLLDPGIENLTILLAGKVPKHASDLLNSRKTEKLLAQFKARFDYIIIDTPPVMPLTDACILGPMVDGVIFVVQAGRTQRDMVAHAETRLSQARAKIVGFVLTNVEHYLPNYLNRYMKQYDSYHYYNNRYYKDREKIQQPAPINA
ncbi:MAG: CpsD/CapB family tyrosine-protein kinase [Candidatus Omnitrophota bacterium]